MDKLLVSECAASLGFPHARNVQFESHQDGKTLRLLTNHKSHVTVAVPIVYIQSVYAPHVESPLPHFDWL